jgi:4-hydroxy-tetrahydrodipicolinate synthase
MKTDDTPAAASRNGAGASAHEIASPPEQPIQGIIPPLVTPLAGRDRLDREGLERLIEHTLAGGVHGLFMLGTTGEGPSLSYRLRRELISATCLIVRGRVPVLVAITDTCLAEAVALANHSAEAGARAVVSSTPYYYPAEQNDLIRYFRALASELPLPLFLYNMPRMTKDRIEPDTVRELMQLDQIVGLKDSSGDMDYFRQVAQAAKARTDWRLFIGAEASLIDALRLGGHGGVNGGGQVAPRLLAGLWDAFHSGDEAQVAALQQRLRRFGAIYSFGGHAAVTQGLKCALSLMGICEDEMALPFAPLGAENRAKVRAILEDLDLMRADISAARAVAAA